MNRAGWRAASAWATRWCTGHGRGVLRTRNLTNVVAVAITGDFETTLSVGVGAGVRKQTWVKVFTLTGPNRVVIDVGADAGSACAEMFACGVLRGMPDSRRKEVGVPYSMVDRSVAFLVGLEGIKRVEFIEPWRAVEEAGGTPELIAQSQDLLRAFDHQDKQVTMYVREGIHDVGAEAYDGLVLTGGGVDADALHRDPHALRLVHEFFAAGKPVAAIGESVRTLAEADVVRGRRVSATPALEGGLRDAGAECVDEHVVVDNGLVTSGNLDDVPTFCHKLVEEFGRVTPLAARQR